MARNGSRAVISVSYICGQSRGVREVPENTRVHLGSAK